MWHIIYINFILLFSVIFQSNVLNEFVKTGLAEKINLCDWYQTDVEKMFISANNIYI